MAGNWRTAAANENSAEALATAYDRGLVRLGEPVQADSQSTSEMGAGWLLLNARPLPARLNGFATSNICEQCFRPHYLVLQKSGHNVVAEISPDTINQEGAVVFASKSRKANEADIGRAWSMVRPGGTIIMAGEKIAGIASLRKWVARRTAVAGHFSKHHAQLFWVTRSDESWPVQEAGKKKQEYRISPGMFSADGPDDGSQLLAGYFDEHIGGHVADFGAGWGYLGTRLLECGAKVSVLDSYEAHWPSLIAAEANIDREGDGPETNFYWLDLTTEPITCTYDWIIMNPPFHVARASDPEIGAAFIRAAQDALKPRGNLLMVANRELPYEKVLAESFADFKILEENNKFKVFHAMRPRHKKGNT